MICNRCGSYEQEGTRFCSRCGNCLINPTYPNVNYNNYNNNYGGNYSGNYNNNYNNNGKQGPDGMAIASLIIGVATVLLSFIFNIFVIPVAIVGFILGIVSKAKGMKIAGIILNILGAIIGITVLALYMIYEYRDDLDYDYDHHYYDSSEKEPEKESNYVSGVWNCKSFDGSGPGGEYIVTMKLNDDLTFTWNKYNDEKNNHVYGHYTYEDEHKQNQSGDYKYYMVDFDGDEFVNEGELQDQKYASQYEMGINEELGEAIVMNVKTYNMYYCFKD